MTEVFMLLTTEGVAGVFSVATAAGSSSFVQE
jgi:hypothetical protein